MRIQTPVVGRGDWETECLGVFGGSLGVGVSGGGKSGRGPIKPSSGKNRHSTNQMKRSRWESSHHGKTRKLLSKLGIAD